LNLIRYRRNESETAGRRAADAMDKPVDLTALAALRPGEGRDALIAALGARWRSPAPHHAGRVKAIVNTYGFEARLDVTDHVARIVFRRPFPAAVAIAGLRLGMSQRQALAALPDLRPTGRMEVYAASHYVADLSDHYRTVVEFHGDELYSVEFFVRDAVYPAKGPMVFPAASGPAGHPFVDPHFKLAVLSALIEADAIDLAEPQDLADFVLPRHIDLGRDGYHFIPEAYDYLVRYPLTDADLAQVDTISFDGGAKIYRYCFYYWGWGTEFDIDSLEGIARCANLRVFRYPTLLVRLDLDHLAGLARLAEIELPAAECRHPERLLDLPALKTLAVPRGVIADPALIAKLRQKGVSIRIAG